MPRRAVRTGCKPSLGTIRTCHLARPRRSLTSLFRYSSLCLTGNWANKYDNELEEEQERLRQRFGHLCGAPAKVSGAPSDETGASALGILIRGPGNIRAVAAEEGLGLHSGPEAKPSSRPSVAIREALIAV